MTSVKALNAKADETVQRKWALLLKKHEYTLNPRKKNEVSERVNFKSEAQGNTVKFTHAILFYCLFNLTHRKNTILRVINAGAKNAYSIINFHPANFFPEYFNSMSLAHPLRAKEVCEVDNSPFNGRKCCACSCQYNFSGDAHQCLHSCDKCIEGE